MFQHFRKTFFTLSASALVAGLTSGSALAERQAQLVSQPQDVDLVIALDVSGSMSGLIDSAKQRLWDIVNELGRAQPQPNLRVAILSYGNPGYGADTGYVHIDQPFTSDLDAVNATLFGFGTNGGDEYVARVVDSSINQLDWTSKPNALKMLFVAGNEAVDQDPQIAVADATRMAASQGIAVNTIYCGTEGDGLSAGWRSAALATNGLFASIDQNAGAVANVATPMDNELVELNEQLNDTYIAFGKDGKRYRDNQRTQDANANAMSKPAAASRTVAKASALYKATQWDLVDAVKSGQSLEDLDESELPEPMQDMTVDEREVFVEEKAKEREALKAQIGKLDAERRDFIKKERAEMQEADEESLDVVMQKGLRTLAEKKGFSFEN